jgi:hypothetical protein
VMKMLGMVGSTGDEAGRLGRVRDGIHATH